VQLVAEVRKKVALELVGLDGNAFNLLGQFRRAAMKQGWSEDEIKVVIDEATNADYDHLLLVLMEHTRSPKSET
jgi:hypothetical protein